MGRGGQGAGAHADIYTVIFLQITIRTVDECVPGQVRAQKQFSWDSIYITSEMEGCYANSYTDRRLSRTVARLWWEAEEPSLAQARCG